MRKRRWGVVLGVLSLLACGEKAQKPKPQDAAPSAKEEAFRLPSGLQVDLVAAACAEQVAVALVFDVGADHDPAGRSGMAYLVGRLLAASAAGWTVEVGRDHTTASIVVAPERLMDELHGAAARLGKLEVTDESVVRARVEALEELARRRGGDAALTARAFAAEAVQPSRGSGWQIGVAAELEAIGAGDADAFWQAHYKPGNARLVVVGRIDPEPVRAHVEKAFGGLPAGTPPAQRPPADATVSGTLVMGDAPAAIAIAVPAPSPSEPTFPAFLVVAARLLAAQGSAWTVHYHPAVSPETLLVTGSLQPNEQPDAAAARIRGELAPVLARPLAPADVAAARDHFGAFLGIQPLAGAGCKQDPRAFAVARARRAQLGVDGAAQAKALDGTTQAQLEEAAKRFDPKRTAAVIAGGAIR